MQMSTIDIQAMVHLPVRLFIVETILAAFFATGYYYYYRRLAGWALRRTNTARGLTYLIRIGIALTTVYLGDQLHMIGWDFNFNAAGLVFHNLGLLVLTVTLVEAGSTWFEYLIRIAGILYVWQMHHMGYFTRPQFALSIVILALIVVVMWWQQKNVRSSFWVHTLIYSVIGLDFWLNLPHHSAGLTVTPTLMIQGFVMYLTMTVTSSLYIYMSQNERAANQQIERQARFDTLTNARSYATYREDVTAAFTQARLDDTPLAMAVVDIDHFKQINDHYGHLAGDELLTGIAKLLDKMMRQNGQHASLYRTGGEEFNLVFPGMTAEEALPIVTACWQAVRSAKLQADDYVIQATLSVGMAERVPNDRAFDDVFARADKALYTSKRSGRDAITINDRTINASTHPRVYTSRILYTQTVVDTQSEGTPATHTEIQLARYEFSTDSWEMPRQFESPVSVQLEYAHRVLQAGPQRLILNLTCKQFADPATMTALRAFQAAEDDLMLLIISLVELPPPAEMERLYAECRKTDIRVMYDEIGTEVPLATMAMYLDVLDGVKFFVNKLRAEHSDDAIVTRMNEWRILVAGKSVDLIVGGVENSHDADFAANKLHARLVQGYYYDRPELPRLS